MPPQYPETDTQKHGRNDVGVFHLAPIHSFIFILIGRVAYQQAQAAADIDRRVSCAEYRQNKN